MYILINLVKRFAQRWLLLFLLLSAALGPAISGISNLIQKKKGGGLTPCCGAGLCGGTVHLKDGKFIHHALCSRCGKKHIRHHTKGESKDMAMHIMNNPSELINAANQLHSRTHGPNIGHGIFHFFKEHVFPAVVQLAPKISSYFSGKYGNKPSPPPLIDFETPPIMAHPRKVNPWDVFERVAGHHGLTKPELRREYEEIPIHFPAQPIVPTTRDLVLHHGHHVPHPGAHHPHVHANAWDKFEHEIGQQGLSKEQIKEKYHAPTPKFNAILDEDPRSFEELYGSGIDEDDIVLKLVCN